MGQINYCLYIRTCMHTHMHTHLHTYTRTCIYPYHKSNNCICKHIVGAKNEKTHDITFVLTFVVACVLQATKVADNAAVMACAENFVTCISEGILTIIRPAYDLGREI